MLSGTTICYLAAAYDGLGRHQDALLLQEKALEFRLRILPEDHPDIGDMHERNSFQQFMRGTGSSINNLAGTLRSLGQHQNALAQFEKALEFYRRVLPANHPDLGTKIVGVLASLVIHARRLRHSDEQLGVRLQRSRSP